MAWYIEDKDGVRKKISGTSIGGGITEVPIATENAVGGVTSSENKGSVSVNPTTGESTVNDNVIIDGSGEIILNGIGNVEGPHTIEITPDPISAAIIGYDDSTTQLGSNNVQDAIEAIDTKSNTNSQNITELDGKVTTNIEDISANKTSIEVVNNNIISLQNNIGYFTNENLLVNGNFLNPINQRGQTTYTGTGYNIDLVNIFARNSNASLDVTNEGIRFYATQNNANSNYYLSRRMEYFKPGTYTLSILCKNITGNQFNALVQLNSNPYTNLLEPQTLVEGLNSYTFTVTQNFALTNVLLAVAKSPYNPGSITIVGAKLEYGNVQTLAKQDSDGNWYLIDSMDDFGERLRKCKTRFQPIYILGINNCYRDSLKTFIANIQFEVEMRATPTPAWTSANYNNIYYDTSYGYGAWLNDGTVLSNTLITPSYMRIGYTLPSTSTALASTCRLWSKRNGSSVGNIGPFWLSAEP